MYLLLDGSCLIDVAGDLVELGNDMIVRVGPGERRRLRSGPDGARVLAIGAMPGGVYRPPADSELGGPEVLAPTAKSSMLA